jgi:D-alanine-D-alanine ligase
VIFPALHGPFGEDGSIQGLAKLANLPCVGSDILGSAVGMDKDVMKRLLREANINTSAFISFTTPEEAIESFANVTKKLGIDIFIKPANLGSSVGITHVKSKQAYLDGVRTAFDYDTKIIVEQTIKGREIEVAVLGNRSPIASVPGEIVNKTYFYSYESKYIDEHGATLLIPAPLDEALTNEFRAVALKTYQTLCCKGMARVDFFFDQQNQIFVNEINTLPGFTAVSMYPKLWEASGISYPELITRLIELSFEEFGERQKLKTKPV